MIDRRTKNAEIFRDTERLYTSDPILIQAVRNSTKTQAFISADKVVRISPPTKTEKANLKYFQNRKCFAMDCSVRGTNFRGLTTLAVKSAITGMVYNRVIPKGK